MSDKIVNHFVLADGSIAKYDADSLANYSDVLEKNLIANGHTKASENLWNVKWEFGSFGWANGLPTNATDVIRTNDFIEVEPGQFYAFYDGRDWAKENYNLSYPIQYVFEYDENETFLRYQAIYVQRFTAGENTRKVKFKSNTVPTTFDLTAFNNLTFALVKKWTYRDIETYYSKNIFDETFSGEKSDNIFDGKTYRRFFSYDKGNNNDLYTGAYLQVSTDYIELPEDESYIYWTVYGLSANRPQYVAFYDESFRWLSYLNAPIFDGAQPFGYIYKASIPENAKYIILSTGNTFQNTAENIAIMDAVEVAVRDNLYVTCDLDDIYAGNIITGENKVDGSDANNDFLEVVSNNNIRPFMYTTLKSYSDDILKSNYDANIPVITDIHTKWAEPYAVLNYMANTGAVDLCVNLGDNITEKFDTKAEALDFLAYVFKAQHKSNGKAPAFSVPGNHDTNPVNAQSISDGANMVLPSDFYATSQGRTTKGMLRDGCYGFYDIENAKIRVVFLNTSDIFDENGTPLINGYKTGLQQAQFAWFCKTALDFSDKKDANEWAVLTMAHDRLSVVGNGAFEAVVTAFTTGTSATATGTRTVDGYTFNLSESVDYSEQGAVDYIGHICGHSHDDAMFDFATNYKEVQIACAVRLAHYYENGVRQDYQREKGTADELLFDTICIDKTEKTVYLKRFGVGSDRQFTY